MWDKVRQIKSSDTAVEKFVFEKSNAVAEAVLYKYPTYQQRTVICCSTQSGCPVGCRFCGAGDNFVRSLKANEIISQPQHLLDLVNQGGTPPTDINRLQIMFMSMGEPLLNYNELSIALRELYSKYPNAALLISTSAPKVPNVYEALRKLSVEIPTIGLQFSVHESTDIARNKLIPFKAKLTLAEMATEGQLWYEVTGRKPFFNYCVHPNNNNITDALALAELFSPSIWEATISVICERDESIAAANIRQKQLASDFMQLMLGLGYSTRMFDPAGQDDIGGGCGQLWFVQDWMKQHPNMTKPTVGFNQPKVHTPV